MEDRRDGKKATRIGKRIMAVMLSLVMMAGVFAGMKLDVKAAETREINLGIIPIWKVKLDIL